MAGLDFSWESSDEAVATVDGSGLVAAAGNGTATITATAGGASGTAAVTVAQPNRAPQAVGSIPDQTVNVGETVTVDIAPYFTDPDRDLLDYNAEVTSAEKATVTMTGSVVTILGVSGGLTLVVVRARDPSGRVAIQHIRVRVNQLNRAPEPVGTIPTQAVTARKNAATVDMSSYFHDPDDDPLSYTGGTSDSGVATVSVRADDVTIEGGSAGSATVTVTAQDPDGLKAEQSFSVTVYGEDGVTGSIEDCYVVNLLFARVIHIVGKVSTRRSVLDVKVHGTANGASAGVAQVGDMAAGEEKDFHLRHTTVYLVGQPRCSIQVRWRDVP